MQAAAGWKHMEVVAAGGMPLLFWCSPAGVGGTADKLPNAGVTGVVAVLLLESIPCTAWLVTR